MSKVKKINVRDIDLDLLQNSRIDDVEKEIDKFKMIDKLDLLIIALIWGKIFIIDFQYSEYVILIVSFIGLIYAFYVTSILKKAKYNIAQLLMHYSNPPLFDKHTQIKVVQSKFTEFNIYMMFGVFGSHFIVSILKIIDHVFLS
ncbi:hypothetical protein [Staphylococcus haemolyticus]|uniref:hypothetical protein n=1 Tax=Staphylococcus haemolyticus TaxID=1283 RepID=UPI002174DF79|nr:hypothetical protein [Staphylococcus haemolyticus]